MNKLRIREILKERGISISEFAEMLGIERQNVYNVFEKPSWKRLEQCSTILDTPIRELFEQEDASYINGFIEYKGKVHKISDIQSFHKLASYIQSDQENNK